MLKHFYRVLILLFAVLMAGHVVQAQTTPIASRYSMTTSPYTYVPVSAANSTEFYDLKTGTSYLDQGGTIYYPAGGSIDDAIFLLGPWGLNGSINIPFAFTMNDGDFTGAYGGVNSNGIYQTLRLNSANSGTVFVDAFNSPSGSGYYDNSRAANLIFGFAGDLEVSPSTAGWYFAVQGAAPNRKMIFEWRNARIKNTTTTVTFQIILNETKEIDIVFGSANGTIPNSAFYTGINEGTAAVAAATPVNAKSNNGQPGNYLGSRFINDSWQSSSNVTNPYGSTGVWPTQNIRYCLTPKLTVSAPNMTLFDGENNTADRTNAGTPIVRTYTYTNNSTSTTPVKITTQLTGAGSAHYSVSPTSVAALNPGSSQTFTVTFNATAFGDLPASLILNGSTPDGATCPVFLTPTTVVLNARTVGMSAVATTVDFGAVAINSVHTQNALLFHNDATTPLVYYFTGPTPTTDYGITGATGTPSTLSGTVPAGGNVYLPVEFRPASQGVKNATVNFYYTNQAGTVRSLDQTIALTGEATPSRIKITRGSTAHVATGSVFAQSVFGSVGEDPLNFDFTVTNNGQGAPVTLRDFEFYDLDRDNPVNGRLRVMWTGGFGSGSPIASNDFRVQQLVNGQWMTVGANDEVSVAAQQSRQMRVQFVPDRRGVNFVRMFFHTDATVDENFNAIQALNVGDVMTPGLQSYDFYGITARNSRIESIEALLFNPTNVGETSTATITIRNTGNSRLLIEEQTLRLIASDKDFTIESAFVGSEKDNGRYVIPVNQSGDVRIRFTPRANGTRLTTLVLVTNDSTDVNGSVGTRYVPITGVGVARGLIAVAAVGSTTTPFSRDTAIVSVPSSYDEADIEIQNTGNAELHIVEVGIEGLNSSDYMLVNPVGPMTLGIGEMSTVRVRFAPSSGGEKSAEFVVRSSAENGDQHVSLRGFAGERLVSKSTSTLFADKQLVVGEKQVESVVVRNTGTVDLSIDAAMLSGSNAGDYMISGSNTAQTIVAGGFVTISVEFTGGDRGARSATLMVTNNSTNEPVVEVSLGGFVGVRTNTHTPDQISMSSTLLPNGEYEEQEVCVEVTNTGDIPMSITSVIVSGSQSSQFEADDKSGTVIGAGEMVRVCVRYRPTQSSAASATLTIATNGTPGDIIIPINGLATGVGDGVVSLGGYVLEPSRPHPAVTSTELVYNLPVGGLVSLELYDMHGRSVRSIVAGSYRSSGEHREQVDVQNLESGMYVYRLNVNGYELRSTMVVVK